MNTKDGKRLIKEDELSYKIIGAAIEVHKTVGPGLLESAYENALSFELRSNGFAVDQQLGLPFFYKEIQQEVGYRIDLLVENSVIVEVKSVEALVPVHYAQTLTYLRLSKLKLALLINFNCTLLKGNIHRIVNNL